MKNLWILFFLLFATQAFAQTAIDVIPNKGAPVADSVVIEKVRSELDVDKYDSVKAQVVSNSPGVFDSILVYMRKQDQVTAKVISVDPFRRVRFFVRESIPENHAHEKALAQSTTVFCPDESVQFISFSHRSLPWDQKAVNQVANLAETSGLKVVRLLKDEATRQNYLNYLSCPRLVADFYDGDANPDQLETDDVPVSSQDVSILLNGAFRNQVTHVWIACKAFNEPMLSAMVKDARSQKFIAGKVDLVAGFADRTGICVMEDALQGKSISKSLDECHARYDLKFHNQWGIGGNGADFLSH